VPWCDDCAKFWSPPSLRDGACPTCGTVLSGPEPAIPVATEDHPKAPWHFKLMLVALVLYLGYRAYQGVDWLAHWAPKHL
jgi:hypothetical protein